MRHKASLLWLTVLFLSACNGSGTLFRQLDRAARLSVEQCIILDASVAEDRTPRTFQGDTLVDGSLTRWISGFFPGTCWLSYELTEDERVKEIAVRRTAALLNPDSYYKDHDIGFQVMCSAGLEWKNTGNEDCLKAIYRGAELLADRFNANTGVIKSWNNEDYQVIIDNMMNLELLTFASKLFNKPEWNEIALSHARTTMTNHFRPDASSYHMLVYNPQNGTVLSKGTVQGNADDSAWSRGQSWGLYGYTMMFRESGDPSFLEHAEKIAGYLMPLLAERPVPAWDFNAPEESIHQDDASAAAIMASAFLELSTLTKDRASARSYRRQAEQILLALSSDDYLAKKGELGGFLIKHCTGFYKKASEIDVPLTYADYYFLEALARYKRL